MKSNVSSYSQVLLLETIKKRFMVKTAEEYNVVNEIMQEYMNEVLKINLVFSPPQNLDDLVGKVLGKRLAVDIDVDYLGGFKTECYSSSPADPTKCKLGNMQQILNSITTAKPFLITISEFVNERGLRIT